MQITSGFMKVSIEPTKLENIKIGECFKFNDKTYIRTDKMAFFDGIYAVDVSNGEYLEFCVENIVTPVNAMLVINGNFGF